MRAGCLVGGLPIDLTGAVAAGALRFPGLPERVEDILSAKGGLDAMEEELMKADAPSLSQTHGFDVGAARIHAPVLRPGKLIGIGMNYRDHAEEIKAKIPAEPLLFGMYSNAVVGPEEPIVLPAMSRQVDYEAELAIVIGARARHVRPEEALGFVAGYTIVHDVSARDLQFADRQWVRAKSFDTFAPMGPCLVSRRALGDADGLGVQLRLNGRTMQNSNTKNLIFKVPALVSHISRVMTLEPGDVIATGTPGGVGFVRNPPVFLKAGDVVEIEIEGIGILRNPVVDAS
jgi:2-keto-4-pentenoate hydratase/2-oxohepta-3-ene-1,7-dioic acid hydratase in catechol pathway